MTPERIPPILAARGLATVVVGTALDRESDDVVAAARDVASAAGARLVVVHALEMPRLVPWSPPAEPDPVGRLRERATALLGEQLQRLGLDGDARVEARLAAGAPDEVLAECAAGCAAGLVVVGAVTGRGRLGKLLGSTAERLAHATHRPLLVVREEMKLPLRRVLAPLDFSPLATASYRAGLGLLRPLGEREVEIEALYVLDPARLEPEPGRRRVPEVRQATRELERVLAESGELVGARQEPRVLVGEPRQEILRRLEERDADLVLVGSRCEGGIHRALIGSVAADVLREAPCNVLLVPPPPTLRERPVAPVESPRVRRGRDGHGQLLRS